MVTFHKRSSGAPHPPHLWWPEHEAITSQLHPVTISVFWIKHESQKVTPTARIIENNSVESFQLKFQLSKMLRRPPISDNSIFSPLEINSNMAYSGEFKKSKEEILKPCLVSHRRKSKQKNCNLFCP